MLSRVSHALFALLTQPKRKITYTALAFLLRLAGWKSFTIDYHRHMSDGIRWIGEHSHQRPTRDICGMRGCISLTVARGIDVEDLLVCLGAEPFQLDEGHLYKDLSSAPLPGGVNPMDVNYAMYGTCGDWVYVLEDWGLATWYLHHGGGPPMPALAGVETISVSDNADIPPSRILHATPEGPIANAEFGEDTGCGSELDTALQEAGAVFPSTSGMHGEEVVLRQVKYLPKLPPAVFSAIGAYCDLSIDQATVEAGNLPVAVLFPLT